MAFAVVFGAGDMARAADTPTTSVELNKLETVAKVCRAYVVVDNPSNEAFQSLKLELVFFRTDGVIDRRLLVDLAPLRADKKSVKPFDLDNLACESVGSILVNDVLDCQGSAGPVPACLDRLKLSSRVPGVAFSK